MGNTDENKVDFDAMQKGAVAIDITHEQLKKIDRGMMHAIDHLDRNWTGDASYQFSVVMNDWRGSFNDICVKLKDLHFALVGNRDLNIKNEHANTPMINKVRSQLHFDGVPHYDK